MRGRSAPAQNGFDGTVRGRELVAVYRAMLPWLLVTWAVAATIPGPAGQQILLVAGASPFLVAAAARGLGMHEGWSVAALAVDRAFTHLTNVLVLLVLTAFAAAIGGTVGAMIAELVGLSDDRILSMPLAVLASLPVLWWHWPAAVIAYLVPDHLHYRRAGSRAWRGPRYGDARRLHGVAGSRRRTGLVLGLNLLWAVLLVAAAGYAGDAGFPRLVQAATYLVFVPFMTALASIETRRMLSLVGRGSDLDSA